MQDKYPFTTKLAITEVQRRLSKAGVEVCYKGEAKKFNAFHWNVFVKFYGFKGEPRYSYDRALKKEKATSFVYSQQSIELVVAELARDPEHVIESMLDRLRKD